MATFTTTTTTLCQKRMVSDTISRLFLFIKYYSFKFERKNPRKRRNYQGLHIAFVSNGINWRVIKFYFRLDIIEQIFPK